MKGDMINVVGNEVSPIEVEGRLLPSARSGCPDISTHGK
jgi:hypothetical protein